MTTEKFISEAETLKEFFEFYCNKKHSDQNLYEKEVYYNDTKYNFQLNLCEECSTLINYSFEKLQNCPHNPKPRCRKCKNPCYEKEQWKQLAKLMRYSGVHLGIVKIFNKLNL